MVLLVWSVNHKKHPKSIELCGWYDSIKSFWRRQILTEVPRGWNVIVAPKILKEK